MMLRANLLLVLLLMLLSHSAVQAAEKIKRPNIILIMCDDMGWSDIGCDGEGRAAVYPVL